MTNTAPRFSIVLPAYNIESYIEESLRCIMAQTFKDFECIVVDDGSTDATKTNALRLIGKDKRFKVVSQHNSGLANARNTGLDLATGEYIIFLDGDDLFEHKLLRVVNNRLKTTKADIVVYNSNGFNNKTGLYSASANINMQTQFIRDNVTFSAKDVNKEIFNLFFNSVWSKVFKRQLLLDNEIRFDDELHRIEDLPFTSAALVVAKSISYIDEILLHYRYNVSSSNTVNNYKHHLDIIRSADRLRDYLDRKNLLEKYQHSFDNAIINDCEYYLWWLSLYPQGAETFQAIKKMLMRYGISKRPRSYFHKGDYFNLKNIIAKGNYEDYLRYVLGYLRDVQQTNNDELEVRQSRIEALDDEIGSLNSKIDQMLHVISDNQARIINAEQATHDILASKSYRLGRAVTKPARLFIDYSKR